MTERKQPRVEHRAVEHLQPEEMPKMENSAEWFTDSRFGLFLHFGAYSQWGKGEWIRSREQLDIAQYQDAVDGFLPERYDPRAWAEQAAAAGMRYAVLTAKHHDGFCLFDSKLTDYTIMNSGFGRDIVAEFLDAFRAQGIKVGLYYSLLDWHHPDYPAYNDENHPHRGDPRWKDADQDFDRYLDYMHGQVDELLTRYGTLDTLWFDFSYQGLVGEAWRGAELVEMIRSRQPRILINNRLDAGAGGLGSLVTDSPTPWAGDLACPESLVPAGGVRNVHGETVPWEVCMTHNNHWAWFEGDTAFKSAKTVVRSLAQTVSKGGNLLFNVGPRPDGTFPERSTALLAEVGDWLQRSGESIYGAGIADIPKPEWGWYTRRADTIYAHVFEPPVGPLALTGIPAHRVRRMRVLNTGEPIERLQTWLTASYPDTVFVTFGPEHTHTYPLPDETNTVIAIELDPA